MIRTKLKKSSMQFKTENGDILIISHDDVCEIANKIIIESMINEKSEYFILQEKKIEKCSMLYKIVIDQKKTMDEKIKKDYLELILEIMQNE